MVSVPDIPLSMLIPLLPNQKKWNYIPLILNIYLFFTSHPPSTSITLGVSSYQVHGSHIRLWRGSSSYNQGYGRVSCALGSNRKAVFVGDFLQHYPGVNQHLCFMVFSPKTRYAVVVKPQRQQLPPWLIQAQPASGNLEVGEGMQAMQLGAPWGPSGPSTVKLFRIDTRYQWCLQMSTPSTRSI